MYGYLVKIPDGWPDDKRKHLYNWLDKTSEGILHHDGNYRAPSYTFMTLEKFADLSSVYVSFQIPHDVEITDVSHWDWSQL